MYAFLCAKFEDYRIMHLHFKNLFKKQQRSLTTCLRLIFQKIWTQVVKIGMMSTDSPMWYSFVKATWSFI